MEGRHDTYWMAPIVADAESGFGGNLNAFELMVPTLVIARTDADSAQLITSDAADVPFITSRDRTYEGFFQIKGGLENAIARGLTYAPYADLTWCETSRPNLSEAREFAQAIHAKFPGTMLAYNCAPSFNGSRNLDPHTIATFQEQLGDMGYKFQFVTLAGFHALNAGMYELALGYRDLGMAAYTQLQDKEFRMEKDLGFSAVKHQSFVGAGYFDQVQLTITGGTASTTAMHGSTEEAQFHA